MGRKTPTSKTIRKIIYTKGDRKIVKFVEQLELRVDVNDDEKQIKPVELSH